MAYTALSIIILSLALYSSHIAINPPNPPAAKEEQVGDQSTIYKALYSSLRFYRLVVYTHFILEIYGCYAAASGASLVGICQKEALAKIYPDGHLSLVNAVSAVSVILGSAIRVACFRAMGKLFTYEVSLKPSHALITTGPYSVVRHPSYTGAFLIMWGLVFSMWSKQSIFQQCITSHYPLTVRTILVIFAVISTVMTIYLMRRTWEEDTLMKREFGKTWDQWASTTKYRLVPYIL